MRKSKFANAKFPTKTVWAAKLKLPITRLYFTTEQIGAKFEQKFSKVWGRIFFASRCCLGCWEYGPHKSWYRRPPTHRHGQCRPTGWSWWLPAPAGSWLSGLHLPFPVNDVCHRDVGHSDWCYHTSRQPRLTRCPVTCHCPPTPCITVIHVFPYSDSCPSHF